MKIICLNGWGGKMHDALLPYLKHEQPDILCLQEVVHSPATSESELTYRDGDHVLPQRTNFFADVCAVLPSHAASFCPAAQGILWDGDTSVPSQWGLATFVSRDLPVIGQAQGFVHKTYGTDGYGDHPRSRSAHVVRVHDHEMGRSVTVGHMHGLRDLRGKMDTAERKAQAQAMLALFDSVVQEDDIAVICGDFNVEPESETLALMRQAGFEELVTSRNFPGTRTAQYLKPGRFADYMLVRGYDGTAEFDVIYTPEVSDHCPLVLTL